MFYLLIQAVALADINNAQVAYDSFSLERALNVALSKMSTALDFSTIVFMQNTYWYGRWRVSALGKGISGGGKIKKFLLSSIDEETGNSAVRGT